MTTPYYLAGADLTAALLNAEPAPLFARKITNFPITNNATPQPDSELAIAVPANTAWAVDSCMIYTATSTADTKYVLAVPAGATKWESSGGLGLNASSSTDFIDMIAKKDASTGVVGGGIGTTTLAMAAFRATVFVGATAGSITMQFSQWIAEASTATLQAGSWMILWKLA